MIAAMATALDSDRVQGVLDDLQRLGAQNDRGYGARVRQREAELGEKLYGQERAEIGAHAPQAVAPEVGHILYGLIITNRPRLTVEFGASFGVSTIYLAAALADLGDGQLITTELIEAKATAVSENLARAGLKDPVEVRQGDARVTLAGIDRPIDMLFLDGSNDLYVEVLRQLDSRLSAGSIIVADLSHGDPHHVRYREHVTDARNGFLSVEIPIDAGLVISTRR